MEFTLVIYLMLSIIVCFVLRPSLQKCVNICNVYDIDMGY